MVFHTTFKQGAIFEKGLYDFSYKFKPFKPFKPLKPKRLLSRQTGPNQNRTGRFR